MVPICRQLPPNHGELQGTWRVLEMQATAPAAPHQGQFHRHTGRIQAQLSTHRGVQGANVADTCPLRVMPAVCPGAGRALLRLEANSGERGSAPAGSQVALEIKESPRLGGTGPGFCTALPGEHHRQCGHLLQTLLAGHKAQARFKQSHPGLLPIGVAQHRANRPGNRLVRITAISADIGLLRATGCSSGSNNCCSRARQNCR